MNVDDFAQLKEPAFFRKYVDSELEKALAGVRAQGNASEWEAEMTGELEWTIHLQGDTLINYILMVSPDLKMIVVTHENTDVGPMSLYQVKQSATFISFYSLYRYSLSEIIYSIMETKSPNHFGFT